MQCTKHPNVETNLACGKCGKPICPKCLVQTPVGMRCAECANLKPLPTYQVSPVYYLRAIGAGLGIAVGCGLAWGAISLILPFYFLRLFVAAGAGYAIGEVISIAVNRKRGAGLAVISGSGATLSFVIAEVFPIAIRQGVLYPTVLFEWGGFYSIVLSLLVLAIAIFMAVLLFR